MLIELSATQLLPARDLAVVSEDAIRLRGAFAHHVEYRERTVEICVLEYLGCMSKHALGGIGSPPTRPDS